ncbi:MAG TPA: DUF3084 domain-containing protein [Abditibacterium sp.]|jgi:uncharacterized protein (DUF3084 family)
MLTPLILFLGLTVATAVIAYWSDNLGKKLGKKRVSLFGLRPRTTATILTISSSWAIMLFTLAFLLATVAPLRRALFRYDRDRAAYARDRAKYNRDISNAQNELSGAKTQLSSTQNQLLQTETSFAAARTQLVSARTALGKASADLKNARAQVKKVETEGRQRIAQARAGEKQARLGAQSAQNRASNAQNRAERAQTQYQRAQDRFARAQTQYERAQTQYIAAQNRAGEAQKRESSARREQLEAEKLARTARDDLRQTQKSLARTNASLRNANASLDNAGKAFLRLSDETLRLQQQEYELRQQVGALASGDVKTTVGQVFAAGIIEAGKSQKLIQDNLGQLLLKGRASLPPDTTLELHPLTDMEGGENEKLEGQKLLQRIARDIAESGLRTSVRLVASRNFLEGENRLEAVFVAVPETPAFSAGETLASAEINGSLGDAQIFRALLDLTDAGRQRAVERRVNPPQSPQEPNFYAAGTNVALFAALRRIEASKKVQRVRLVAADELSTVEPLRVRFEIEGDSSPGPSDDSQ